MIVDARMLHQERFGEQRRDEVAGDELAGAVDEEAAVRVAVPGDADVCFLGDHALDDVAAVLLDERVRLVVREGPSTISKHSRVVWHGSRSNRRGATSPPMPLPASSTTLNGLMRRDRRTATRAARRRRACPGASPGRGGRSAPVSCPRQSSREYRRCPLRRSAETPRVAPFSCRCTAWDCATRSPERHRRVRPRDREIEHAGPDHPVVGDVGALRQTHLR